MVLEESFYSLFGESLYIRLMLLINQHKKIDHPDKLPEDIKKKLRKYLPELTQTLKKDIVINTEMVNINTEGVDIGFNNNK